MINFKSIKARDVTVGARIVLDMGYGPHSMDEVCTVVSVIHGKSLFDDDVVKLKVRRPFGELMNICDFLPDDKLDAEA
jgi:hypothetical protein